MHKIIPAVFFLLAVVFSSETFSQSSWTGIHLTVAGYNTVDGVEASFQLGKCNGEEVVFLKLINHNDYPVTVTWNDAIFTQELKWVQKEKIEEKSFVLNANEEVIGNCGSGSASELRIPLKDFIKNKKDFKRYGAANFAVARK
jgi:hypothetical protein